MVVSNLRLEHFVKLGLEVSASPFLVCMAKVSIASDVGNHYSGKSALHAAHSAPLAQRILFRARAAGKAPALSEAMLLPSSDSAPT
jgi:hypothetical protein